MLTELQLQNYRGFSAHMSPFRDFSVIVGANNAGKSTIIEALSLVAIVASRARFLSYMTPPSWLNEPSAARGIAPSLSGLEFEYLNLGHQYEMGPASLRAKLVDGWSISIHLHPEEEEIFATIRDRDGHLITSKSMAGRLPRNTIEVLPPVGRLNTHERVLQEDYARRHLGSYLAPQHFRNQLYFFGNVPAQSTDIRGDGSSDGVTRYEAFCGLAQSSWPGLQIVELQPPKGQDRELRLLVRDGPFVTEVGSVGSGLQAWLQTCWFLARCSAHSAIVLDEPDVFLHADLQRKLVRLVKDHFPQVIIATHSVEIMSEVDPDEVLIIDRHKDQSTFAEKIPAVQQVINHIGSANNLQLARLWAAKKCLFLEGNDLEFLNAFHETLFENLHTSISALPTISIGGFGNWREAVATAGGFRQVGDDSIKAYCILDSDYRTNVEHKKIVKRAEKEGLYLHVWSKKEIENYVVEPAAIQRLIAKRSSGPVPPDLQEIRTQIESVCDELKEDATIQFAQEIQRLEKVTLSEAMTTAQKYISAKWQTFDGKVGTCSGKRIVSMLSAWAQASFGVSFGALSIAREMDGDEINSEVKMVVGAIETGDPFNLN